MTSIREIFINNLKFYRKQKGFSQEKLSNAINMSMAYINQIENKGSWPQPEIVDKIAEVLQIQSSLLFMTDASPENLKEFDRENYIDCLSERIFSKIKTVLIEEIRK